MTDLSKLPSKTSNTHLIKSANHQQHTNPTISSAQETISASCAKQNEIIPQNIPQRKNIPFDTQKTLTAVQVENTKQSQNPISNTLINKSVNNPSKSFKVSSDNDDNQVHPNIKLPTDPKKDEMKQDTENPVKSKFSISKSPEGNSSYLQSNESTDNDNTELQTEIKLPINEKEDTKKSDIESPNQSKSLSIIKDDTINSDMTDSSKLPSKTNNTNLITSANLQQHTNPTISSAQETISVSGAKENEIIPQNILQQENIPSDTQKTLTAVQLENTTQYQNPLSNTEIPVKSKISNPKSPEGNSSYLQSNEFNDNDNTELQTESKLPTNEKRNKKVSDKETPNQSKNLSPKRPLKKRSNTRITISRTNKVPEAKKKRTY